jgi:hypothetical protein
MADAMPADIMSNDEDSILLNPLCLDSQQSEARLLSKKDPHHVIGELHRDEDLHRTDIYQHHGNDGIHIDDASEDSGFIFREAASSYNDITSPSRTRSVDGAYFQWILELLMVLFATAIFIAICLLLSHYHNQELPDWRNLHITLNTLISILATVLRATIAFIAFEILAQLKWDWLSICFRPLQHVQLFDSVSRGVYGSLRLLPVIALRQPLALTAIFIVVLSSGIGSFTQQSIQTYQCLRAASPDVNDATIKVANAVDEHNLTARWTGGGASTMRLNLQMQVAIEDSVINPSRGTNVGSLFTCSSGNCTFPKLSNGPDGKTHKPCSHASLGICNKCVDIYDIVQGPIVLADTIDGKQKEAAMFALPIPIYDRLAGTPLRGGPAKISISKYAFNQVRRRLPSTTLLGLRRR